MKNNVVLIFILLLFSALSSCKKDNNSFTSYGYDIGSRGQIISYELIETLDTAILSTRLNSLGAGLSSLIHLNYTISAYRVEYKSLNVFGDTIKASGVIIFPHLSNKKIALSSYQHGTALMKTNVSSIHQGLEYLVNAVLAAEGGILCCMPDYLGMGTGDGMHKYLNPTEESNSVIDILRAARYLNADLHHTQLNGQVFIFGYSQGGHATLAAQRDIETKYNREFTLTASAPMAGPYCLSRTSQFDVMIDSVYYPNPFYLPYIAVSVYEATRGMVAYSTIFKAPYDSLIPAIINGQYSEGYANDRFPYYISNIVKDSVKNSARNNPNDLIRSTLRTYDLVDGWTPHVPTRFYHCEGDDNVFYDNATCAVNTFFARGGNVELVNMGPSNHTDCAPPTFILARQWIYELKRID